ncbi:MAG: hypothetical protein COT43_02600 [Candidatus Marinimicrobia bacterium CG08_land_8_20_14_0_20_45_22]|nr:MAG: hypothetical protein COT43_02600 [Candidatus Marinimicrobia bacterium CG08_land_8_20_14_0_20_45_22]
MIIWKDYFNQLNRLNCWLKIIEKQRYPRTLVHHCWAETHFIFQIPVHELKLAAMASFCVVIFSAF